MPEVPPIPNGPLMPRPPVSRPVTAPAGVQRAACRACGRLIDASDSYCRYCGRRQTAGEAWFYHPLWILILAFFVLGPFALPLVWLSTKMKPGVKAALSVAIIVYTAFTVYYAYEVTVMVMRNFSALGDLQRFM